MLVKKCLGIHLNSDAMKYDALSSKHRDILVLLGMTITNQLRKKSGFYSSDKLSNTPSKYFYDLYIPVKILERLNSQLIFMHRDSSSNIL